MPTCNELLGNIHGALDIFLNRLNAEANKRELEIHQVLHIHEGQYPNIVTINPVFEKLSDPNGLNFQNIRLSHSFDETLRHGEAPMNIDFPLTSYLSNNESNLYKTNSQLPYTNPMLRKKGGISHLLKIQEFFDTPYISKIVKTFSYLNLSTFPFFLIYTIYNPSLLLIALTAPQPLVFLSAFFIYKIVPYALNLEKKWREELSDLLDRVDELVDNNEIEKARNLFPKHVTTDRREQFWDTWFKMFRKPANTSNKIHIDYTLWPVRPKNWHYQVVLSTFFSNNALRYRFFYLRDIKIASCKLISQEILDSVEDLELFLEAAHKRLNDGVDIYLRSDSNISTNLMHNITDFRVIRTRPRSYYNNGLRYVESIPVSLKMIYPGTVIDNKDLVAVIPTHEELLKKYIDPYKQSIQRCVDLLMNGNLVDLDHEMMEMDKKGGVRNGFSIFMSPASEAVYLQLKTILTISESLYFREFKQKYYAPNDEVVSCLHFNCEKNEAIIMNIHKLIMFLKYQFPDKKELINKYESIIQQFNDNTKIANLAVRSWKKYCQEHNLIDTLEILNDVETTDNQNHTNIVTKFTGFLWQEAKTLGNKISSYVPSSVQFKKRQRTLVY